MNKSARMKKLLFALSSCAACIVSSCSLELAEPETAPEPVGGKMTEVVISAANVMETKTVLVRDGETSHYSVHFVQGDELAVFDGGGAPLRFGICSDVAEDGSVDFTGEIHEDVIDDDYDSDILALYPYRKTAVFANGMINTVLPSTQLAVEDSFGYEANVSVGICEKIQSDPGHFSLQLKNVCALVKFTVPLGVSVSKVALSSNNGEPLAGDISVTPGDEPSCTVTKGTDTVELTGSEFAGKTFCFAVLPGTLTKGFTLRLFCNDLQRPFAEIRTAKSVTFTRSRILNLGTLNCRNTGEFAGSGTDEDPYIITSFEQLHTMEILINRGRFHEADEDGSLALMAKYKAASYYLAADIDCGRNDFGIGFDSPFENEGCIRFTGHFNGGGHCISNYFMNSGSDASLGLFRYVEGARIENLTVCPYNVVRTSDTAIKGIGFSQLGFLVGHVHSASKDEVTQITNCHTNPISYHPCSDWIPNQGDFGVGGLVGKVQGNLVISNCTNRAHLDITQGNEAPEYGTAETGTNMHLGGIVGMICYNENFHVTCTIDRCRNTGNIHLEAKNVHGNPYDGWARKVGGILGAEIDYVGKKDVMVGITNCVNNGNISLGGGVRQDSYAGGIVGHNASDGVDSDEPYIYNCLNTGDVHSYSRHVACGGVVGFNYSGDTCIALCVNTGAITGSGYDDSDDPIVGAISGDSDFWHQRAYCVDCYWTNDSNMQCTGDGPMDNCSYKNPLTSDYLNGRKASITGRMDDGSEWSGTQWTASAAWTGSVEADGTNTLDLDIVR